MNEPESENSSSNPRDEFVRRAVRFDRLPTHWELCQLAATVGNELPQDHSFKSVKEAGKRVALAMHIWEAAGAKLIEASERWERHGRSFDELSPLYGPLKVGNHFLPRLTQWNVNHFGDDDSGQASIALPSFLETVIGLAKEEDRMKWWREYLTSKVKADQHSDQWDDYEDITEVMKQRPEWREPEDFTLPVRCIPDIIAKMKKRGIAPGFSASYYLEEFRKWRLTMKSPTKKATVPYDLEDCRKKGLEAELDG